MTAPTRTRKASTPPPKRKTQAGRGSGADRKAAPTKRADSTQGSRSSAAERAYARRAQRADAARRTSTGNSQRRAPQPGLRGKLLPRWPRSRASFVLMIMAMLAAGVAITLWLSTQAIAGSYTLDRLHEKNAELAERVAQLQRVVTKRESATWLAQEARELGMVPGGFPAKLVVHKDGSVTVVGEPVKVTAPPAPPPAPEPEPTSAPESAPAPEPNPSPEASGDGADEQAGEGAGEQDTVTAGAGG